jgi:hypothetical protein
MWTKGRVEVGHTHEDLVVDGHVEVHTVRDHGSVRGLGCR